MRIGNEEIAKRYILCSVTLAMYVVAYLLFRTNMSLFVAIHSLVFLIMMMILSSGEKACAVLIVVLLGISIVVNVVLFCSIPLFAILPAAMSCGLIMYIVLGKRMRTIINESEEKRRRAEEQIKENQFIYEEKEQSLHKLENKVNEIFELFEVAKELNECINVNEVMQVLHRTVFSELPFMSGMIVLLNTEVDEDEQYTIYPMQGEKPSAKDKEVYVIAHLAHFLRQYKKTIKVNRAELCHFDFLDIKAVHFPLWIFPLIIKGDLIAVFILEGGDEQDFSKFSIIAGQLTLQIKKISLYNTVRELSITDGLTNVFVRRHFLERFNEELKRSIKHGFELSILMLDIDHFKSYNDTFGHLVGDVTLREVSRLIKEKVRKVDLISRYGGEEFAIVLPETAKEGGVEVAERIRSAVARKRFKVYDEETRVTVSIGIASFPSDLGSEVHEFSPELVQLLIEKADISLYKAKEEGRNRVVSYQ